MTYEMEGDRGNGGPFLLFNLVCEWPLAGHCYISFSTHDQAVRKVIHFQSSFDAFLLAAKSYTVGEIKVRAI